MPLDDTELARLNDLLMRLNSLHPEDQNHLDELIGRILTVQGSLISPKKARKWTVRLFFDGMGMASGILGPITGGVSYVFALIGMIDFFNVLREDNEITNRDILARNELQLIIREVDRLEKANRRRG
jgi:hypothetical protein